MFITIAYLIFIFLDFIQSELKCPKSTPIAKGGKCRLVYCDNEEFENRECIIANEIIKEQWINEVQTFKGIKTNNQPYVNTLKNGDTYFCIVSPIIKIKENNFLICYGYNKNFEGLFNGFSNLTLESNTQIINDKRTEIITFNNKLYYIIRTDKTKSVNYFFDLFNKKYYSTNWNPYNFNDVFIKFKNEKDTFFLGFHQNSYIFYSKYKIIKENEDKILHRKFLKSDSESPFTCIQIESKYIECLYKQNDKSGIDGKLGLLLLNSSNIEKVGNIEIYNIGNLLVYANMIHLKDEVGIIYFYTKNYAYLSLKKFNLGNNFSLDNYIFGVSEINLNPKNIYNFINNQPIIKFNNNKFAIFLTVIRDDPTYYTKDIHEKIIIYIFNLYNNDLSLSSRKYIINLNLFDNKCIYKDTLKPFILGEYLGFTSTLTSIKNNIIQNNYPGIIIFGFTYETNKSGEVNKILRYNETNSIIIIKDYLKFLQNNLFGYEINGIKITKLPNEVECGSFIKEGKKIKEEDVIQYESKLKFILSRKMIQNIYSIKFKSVIKEPNYDKMNKFSDEVFFYGKTLPPEDNFYIPKELQTKEIEVKFIINCYSSCQQCLKYSEDPSNQQCLKCKNGYYFLNMSTNCINITPEKYYFNEEYQKFLPCNKNCLSCNGQELDQFFMNCKTCELGYKLYNKTNNCLKCEKYVDYKQEKCINRLPEGYYLSNKELQTIEKCHKDCKECNKGPEILENGAFTSNCLSCMQENTYPNNLLNCEESKQNSESKINIFVEYKIYFILIIPVFIIIIIPVILFLVKYKKNKNNKINFGDEFLSKENPICSVSFKEEQE